jgi:hypothetical protein
MSEYWNLLRKKCEVRTKYHETPKNILLDLVTFILVTSISRNLSNTLPQ